MGSKEGLFRCKTQVFSLCAKLTLDTFMSQNEMLQFRPLLSSSTASQSDENKETREMQESVAFSTTCEWNTC